MDGNKRASKMNAPHGSEMAIREMLNYGYKLGSRLHTKANEIIEPIHLKQQKGIVSLGYEPALEGSHMPTLGKRYLC